ncbi:MAG: hypothetical protein ACYCSO_08190 [Cuniculiplasma sp.]
MNKPIDSGDRETLCSIIFTQSRSERGVRGFARVCSILESDRKKGKRPFRANPG